MQSVAVKLVVDREREIEAFKTEEYWKITALLAPQGLAKLGDVQFPAKVLAKKKGAEAGRREARGTSRTPDDRDAASKRGRPARRSRRRSREKVEAAEDSARAVSSPSSTSGRARSSRPAPRPKRTRSTPSSNRAAYAVTKIEQKDRQRQRPAAVHHVHAAAAGEHRGCTWAPSGRCRPPSGSTKASTSGTKGRSPSSPTCEPTARASRTTPCTMVREPHRQRVTARATCRRSRTSSSRARAPGSPRGDPADRPDEHAAARAAVPRPRPVPAVHADLQPLRRQPDDAGRLRGHERRDQGRPGGVQGQGADREVRRLPQGAGRPASKRT